MLDDLPRGLASLVAQGPQADPGCPERHTSSQQAQLIMERTLNPRAPAPLQQREDHFLRAALSTTRSWDSCTNVSKMFQLKPGLHLALKNT